MSHAILPTFPTFHQPAGSLVLGSAYIPILYTACLIPPSQEKPVLIWYVARPSRVGVLRPRGYGWPRGAQARSKDLPVMTCQGPNGGNGGNNPGIRICRSWS